MGYLDGKSAAKPKIKFVAYVDIVKIQDGVRADELLRVTVRGEDEADAGIRAVNQLKTHLESLNHD